MCVLECLKKHVPVWNWGVWNWGVLGVELWGFGVELKDFGAEEVWSLYATDVLNWGGLCGTELSWGILAFLRLCLEFP